MSTDAPLLEISQLDVVYRRRRSSVAAVQDVSFDVARGRTVGLVGESGSGKSSIGAVVLGLVAPTGGEVRFDGEPLSRRDRTSREVLARRIQAVFQDPFGSMNPARQIGQTLAEPLHYSLKLSREQARERITQALHDVAMDVEALTRYPSQFSGGQLQRLAIARALVVEPDFIVCDEAVSALDLSVQAQVVNLLEGLSRTRGLAYLFISHDLSVVQHISDEIVVLYRGSVMERGPAALVAEHPAHPYTQNLVLSAPVPDPAAQRERRVARLARRSAPSGAGVGPQSTGTGFSSTGFSGPGEGCPYAARCPFAIAVCRTRRPALELHAPGRLVACHRYDEVKDAATASPHPAETAPLLATAAARAEEGTDAG